jgi:hypothetical protein
MLETNDDANKRANVDGNKAELNKQNVTDKRKPTIQVSKRESFNSGRSRTRRKNERPSSVTSGPDSKYAKHAITRTRLKANRQQGLRASDAEHV